MRRNSAILVAVSSLATLIATASPSFSQNSIDAKTQKLVQEVQTELGTERPDTPRRRVYHLKRKDYSTEEVIEVARVLREKGYDPSITEYATYVGLEVVNPTASK